MAEPIHREGGHSSTDVLDAYDLQQFADQEAANNHAYSGDTTHSSFDYYRSAELLMGGLITGIAASGAAEGLTIEEAEEEDKKRREFESYSNRVILQIAQIDEAIAILEERNREIDRQVAQWQSEQNTLQAQLDDIPIQKIKIQSFLTGLPAVRDQLDTALKQTIQQAEDLKFQAGEVYQRLQKDGLPDNVLHITRYAKKDLCSQEADIEVAVYKDVKGFYYTDPLTKERVDITNELQLIALRYQMEKEGKVAANDLTDELDLLKLDSYKDAAARFAYLKDAQEKQEKIADALRATQAELTTLEAQKREQLEKLEKKEIQLRDEIEELERKMRAARADKQSNLAQIQQLYKQKEQLLAGMISEERTLKTDITGYEEKLDEIERDLFVASKKQNDYIQAQIDYDIGYQGIWIGGNCYLNAKKELKSEENNVMMVTRDDKGLHLEYAVHKDTKGYFYYNIDGERKTISPKELAGKSGRVVEDFQPESAVAKADIMMRNSAYEMSIAMEKTNRAAEMLPQDMGREVIVNPNLYDVIYSKAKLPPPSDEKAEMDEAMARIEDKLKGGKTITRGNLDDALFYAPPEIREKILAELEEKKIAIVEGPRTAEAPKPLIILSSSDRFLQEQQLYQNQRNNYGIGYGDDVGGALGATSGTMLASNTPLPAPQIFTGEPGPHVAVPELDPTNVPRIEAGQMTLATNITIDGTDGMTSLTDRGTFATAAAPPAAPGQQRGPHLGTTMNA